VLIADSWRPMRGCARNSFKRKVTFARQRSRGINAMTVPTNAPMPVEMLSYSRLDEPLNCSPQTARSFPPPWRFEEFPEGYRVLDAHDRVLAYVVASQQIADAESKQLSLDEAWRLARVIAGLPDLVKETPLGHTRRSWWKWLKSRSN
jgi:hypothetical protein